MKKINKKSSFLDKIQLEFKKIVGLSIILNILFLLFGILIYMNPYMSLKLTGVIIGIYFIIFGLFNIYEYFNRMEVSLFKYKIFGGILSLILGIFVIINPFKLVKILTIAFGIYLIIHSLSKAIEALKLKRFNYDGWLIILVTSVILLIFGVFVTINPMASMDIIEVVAIFIILSTILEIANLLMTYGKAKEIVKLIKGE